MQTRLFRGGATLLFVVGALQACHGDDDGGTTGPVASIQIAVAPVSLVVPQGGDATVTLTLTRGGNFTGTVAVSVEGLPAGLSASVVPAALVGTTNSAAVTLAASASATPGTYTPTVRATASGVGAASASVAVTVTAAPAVAIAVTPTTLTVQAGATGAATVNLTRTNFTGGVALTLDAPPVGVSGSFTPASVTGETAALAVAVAASVAAGDYPVTIKATAPGIDDRAAVLTVRVLAPAGTLALTLTPSGTSVTQGGAGEAFVNIARTNVTTPVTLSASGMPAGLAIAFDENPTTLAQARLTYSAAATTALGNHTITVTGQAAGVQPASGSFVVQVIVPPPVTQVEYQFCSASENPVFFAVRDGIGSWQVVTSTLSSGVYRYRFAVSQPVGGVFYVQQSGSAIAARGVAAPTGWPSTRLVPDALAQLLPQVAAPTYETTVLFASAEELATQGLETCDESLSTKSVWLQVAGVGNAQSATLSLGGSTTTFDGLLDLSPVELVGVRSGVVDFVGVRQALQSGVPNMLLDVRGLTPADGSTLPFIADFDGVSAYPPATAQLTVANALGDALLTFGRFFTSHGEVGDLGGAAAPSAATFRTWYGLPPARLQPGDVHASTVLAVPAASATSEARFHVRYSTIVQDITQTLGRRLPTPSVSSVGTTSYRRLRIQGTLPSEYDALVSATAEQSGGESQVTLLATGRYLAATGSAAAYDLTIPDLTSLAGFPVASTLPAGEIEVTVSGIGWSGLGTLAPLPSNDVSFLAALKEVKVMVP
ncbi:MAG: hypothetical protein IT360_06990 [Gemmatimonadaceae bacterium]|nr:hypothetical protein [Gemmatimonadaceae bacterium]